MTTPRPEWRPIEEAPKERGAILVWCPERKNIYVVCWWQGYRGEPGWCHFGGGSGALSEEPTHFMPLPSPPSSAEQADE